MVVQWCAVVAYGRAVVNGSTVVQWVYVWLCDDVQLCGTAVYGRVQ